MELCGLWSRALGSLLLLKVVCTYHGDHGFYYQPFQETAQCFFVYKVQVMNNWCFLFLFIQTDDRTIKLV